MSTQLRFEIIKEGEVTRTEDLDQDVIKVGKLQSSHLKLDDPNVSRIHAVIERSQSDGSLTVIDLGSATGTFVNGEKVTKTTLSTGDEMRFGDTTIRVSIIETAPVVSAPQVVAPSLADAPQVMDAIATIAPNSQPAPAPEHAPAAAPVSGFVSTPEGEQVEPFTLQGYYDDSGNYIPGYYDNEATFHLGYGFYDDNAVWNVSHGYYDPAGEWIASDQPVASVANPSSDGFAAHIPPTHAEQFQNNLGEEDSWLLYDVSDRKEYQNSFFKEQGGDTLEVAMLWGDHVLAVNSYNNKSVTIGDDVKTDDFILENTNLELVSYSGGGYSVQFKGGMTGQIQRGNESWSLAEAIERGIASGGGSTYSLPLDSRTSVRVDIDDTTFLVHFTDLPIFAAGGASVDWTAAPYIGLSAFIHGLFLMIVFFNPEGANSLDLDAFSADDRFVQLMIEPEEEEEEEPDMMDGAGEEAAAKHAGEEGKAGKEDAPDANKKLAIKGDSEDLTLKKARDTQIAMDSGIASELMVSSPFGTGDTSIGSDVIHALGNLEGEGYGESRGLGGLGVSGAGRGGGGISERGIGLSDTGTAGRGGRGRGGKGYGKSAGDLGERRARVPKVIPGRPIVQGSLDRAIIRRVVRQHRREIKYCYEKELQKNKNLGGTVKIKFTISASGSVISSRVASSSLNNKKVERCMAGKVRRWVFPEPKGGGIVIVKYPFNLKS